MDVYDQKAYSYNQIHVSHQLLMFLLMIEFVTVNLISYFAKLVVLSIVIHSFDVFWLMILPFDYGLSSEYF